MFSDLYRCGSILICHLGERLPITLPLCPSCQLNQHLKDSLCQQLLQLDEVSVLAPVVSTTEGEGDMEQQVSTDYSVDLVQDLSPHSEWGLVENIFSCFNIPLSYISSLTLSLCHLISLSQDEKQRFSSVLLLARLLAKFLGYISFLPYQTSERPSREIQEATATLRSKVLWHQTWNSSLWKQFRKWTSNQN